MKTVDLDLNKLLGFRLLTAEGLSDARLASKIGAKPGIKTPSLHAPAGSRIGGKIGSKIGSKVG